jgi:hypothetical protein
LPDLGKKQCARRLPFSIAHHRSAIRRDMLKWLIHAANRGRFAFRTLGARPVL